MAVPKRRQSKHRRNNRRSHDALKRIQLVRCSNCSAAIKPHHICANCGYYRGRQMIVGKMA